jgi:hypothetical protein
VVDGPRKPQEYFLIGVDSSGTVAYGLTKFFMFKFDIVKNEIVENVMLNSLWPSLSFLPHAFDLTDSWAVIIGYGHSTAGKKQYVTLGCLIDLISFTGLSCQTLIRETTYLVPSKVVVYNELYEMSVAIRNKKILVGIPRLDSVVVLTNTGTSLIVSHVHTVSYTSSSSFGRSVDWVDDSTIAVLVYNSFLTPWSKSQIFVYKETSVSLTSALYTFPNSQQIIGKRLSNPYLVRLVITTKGNMALLTDRSDILIVPIAPAGYVSTWIDMTNITFVFYYSFTLCIGGTYKNDSGLGPCSICPPGTRNPGTLSNRVTTCMSCSGNSSNSFCPLASLVDIDPNRIPSYTQATAYPVTADTTDIEDILLENVFQISSNPHCLMISPLFWALVVGTFSFLIWMGMWVIKLCKWKQGMSYRKKAKTIFKSTDLIGEGTLWIGGLITFPLFVLLSFSYWFSVSFLHRYPIEQVTGPPNFSCDKTLINSKFSTGLELLSVPKGMDAQPIFNHLNNQVFELTVELINTGFTCANITAQENRIGSYASISMFCRRSISDAITSVTFSLPHHYATVQLNLTGPHWIGGARLCVRAAGYSDKIYTLQELDFCKFFSTPNQTLGRASRFPVIFTKSINMTRTMENRAPNLFLGLWIPTFGGGTSSDEIYYTQFGDYLRYISALTIVQFVFDERAFYIKNIQSPIVRPPQMLFHALLFTSLCIELFALIFLFANLLIVPIIRRIQSACRQRRRRKKNHHQTTNKKLVTLNQHQSSTCTIGIQVDFDTVSVVESPQSNKY